MTKAEMTNNASENAAADRFDLEERTALFGIAVIQLARSVTLDAVTDPIVRQVVRAGGSVGANYAEADEAGSRKEFRYRISLCARESRETRHWVRMLVAAVPDLRDAAAPIWKASQELSRIFGSIKKKTKPAPE